MLTRLDLILARLGPTGTVHSAPPDPGAPLTGLRRIFTSLALCSLGLLGLVCGSRPAHAQGSLPDGLLIEAEFGRFEAIQAEGVIVYQADSVTGLRVRGERWFVKGGKRQRQTFDIRAEAAAVFLAPIEVGEKLGGRLPVWGLYAQGFVRVEVSGEGLGRHVIEAEEVFLDFRNERARLRKGLLRASSGKGSGVLGAKRLLVKAEEMRAQGADFLEAKGATVTVCRYTYPLWAIGADRITIRGSEAGTPAPTAMAAFGGPVGALAQRWAPRGRLLAGVMGGPQFRTREWSPVGGSDGLLRARDPGYQLEAEGVHLQILPPGLGLGTDSITTPGFPFLGWNTDWPLPQLRVGSSSRLGIFGTARVRTELTRLRHSSFGELRLKGEAGADYFERRGTAGAAGLSWTRKGLGLAPGEISEGEGFLRGYAIDDRADQDRVGTTIRNEGRFWLRGLVHERRQLGEGRLVLDAEVSRVSDPGMLLEYFRSVAQTEKEQETYAYLRGSYDDLGGRLIGRVRINDWQDQVERTPEGRLDWITHPLVVEPGIGGVYLDLALRGGHLRLRPTNATGDPGYRAWRGDFQGTLRFKTSLGPVQLHGWGGARESLWSARADEEQSVDRFAASAGWNASTLLWRRFATPFGVLRHELIPELGTRHVFGVNRSPSELLRFDEVEDVEPTDEGFLRLRTRLLTDHSGRRRKLLDISVEAVYLMRSHRRVVRGRRFAPDPFRGRDWLYLRYDLRLDVFAWLSGRIRAEQDVNGFGLVDLNASATFRAGVLGKPVSGLELDVAYRELRGPTASQALSWGLRWQLTKHWAVGLEQQYDFVSREFLRHRGRLIRFFQGFALEVSVSHDPQQDDTSVSASIAPSFDDRRPAFGADPRYPGN
ncbi:MAG: hypothetical protein JKY65_21315 [Planctomycetes bacterium]|nr:hypothetical protein [Planctomycetota bacterium]